MVLTLHVKKKNHREEDSTDRLKEARYSCTSVSLVFRRTNEANGYLSEPGVAKFSRITRYMVEEKQLLLILESGARTFS